MWECSQKAHGSHKFLLSLLQERVIGQSPASEPDTFKDNEARAESLDLTATNDVAA